MRQRRRIAVTQQAFEHRIERRAFRIDALAAAPLLGTLGRQGVDVAGLPRAGQRDVEQAEALVLGLLRVAALRRVAERDHAAAAGRIVQQRDLAGPAAAGPHQRQHDYLEFQALARVQGHQRDACGVGFDAQLFFLGRLALAAAAFALVGQPGQQQVAAGQRIALRLQQLAEMAQVGQRALAVGAGEQARAGALDHRAHRREHAARAPRRVQLAEHGGFALPGVGIGVQRAQLVPAAPAQPGRQRGAHGAVVARMQRRVQDDLQFARPRRAEHVVAAGRHARNVARLQPRAQVRDVAVARQQHGDVAGPQRTPADGVPAGQQVDDLVGAGFQRGGPPCGLRLRHVALAQEVDLQRPLAGDAVDRVRIAAPVRLHRLVADLVLRIRAEHLARVRVERVQRGDQGLRGTEVGIQRHRVGGAAARGEVGVDVAAAEAVDRLLGVADHHQAAARRAVRVAIDAVEDAVLQRVGVLEFVHQRHRPRLEQARRERLAVRAQRFVHAHDQRVEGELAGHCEPARDVGARPLRPRLPAARPGGLREFGTDLQHARNQPERDADVGLGAGFRLEVRVRFGQRLAVRIGDRRGRIGEPAEQRAERVLQPRVRLARIGRRVVFVLRGEGPQGLQRVRRQVRAQGVGVGHAHRHARSERGAQGLLQFAQAARQVRARSVGGVRLALEQSPPQVVGAVLDQVVASDEFARVERYAALERKVGQDAPTQAVQRADRRQIEFGQRQPQPVQIGARAACRVRGTGPAPAQPVRVGRRIGILHDAPVGQPLGPQQAFADAFAQFLRGSVGEGGDDDALRRQPLLQQQAQVQHRDRPGLAGARAGLDQAAAAGQQRQCAPACVLRGGAHDRSSAAAASSWISVRRCAACRRSSSWSSASVKSRSPASSDA